MVGLRVILILTLILAAIIGQASDALEPVKIDSTKFVVIGDMLIEQNTVAMAHDSNDPDTLGARPLKVVLWTDGVLPIVFAKHVDQETRKLVWAACREWQSAANVRCKPGRYKGRRLYISRQFLGIKVGCWSMLGQEAYFLGIKRRMNLGQGCNYYDIVLHELGHALGLGHEHQRSDRDQYVKILRENLDDPYLGLGYKVNLSTQATELLNPYDFLSIMHYSRRSFSKNGENTIVPLPAYAPYLDVMGQTEHLSEWDRVAIRNLYGPPLPQFAK